MTVTVANDTPRAIREILERWFAERKPAAFVGTVNRRTRDKVPEYVKRNARGTSLLVLTSELKCQEFKIELWGAPDRRDVEMSGLWLVAEHWSNEADRQRWTLAPLNLKTELPRTVDSEVRLVPYDEAVRHLQGNAFNELATQHGRRKPTLTT